MAKEVMNTREAAEYIGVLYSYMRAIRSQGPREGKMTHPPVHYIDIKSQKTALYLKEELDEWLRRLPKKYALEVEPEQKPEDVSYER